MLALSIRQPWASLILKVGKDIEAIEGGDHATVRQFFEIYRFD